MQKEKIWEIVFYSSLSVVMIWVILKSVGIIQTPFWLEYGVPIAGFVIGILSLYQNLTNNIKELAIDLAKISVKLSHVEKDVDVLKSEVSKNRG